MKPLHLMDDLNRDDLFPNILNKGDTLHDLELNGNNSCASSYPFTSLMHACWLASSLLRVDYITYAGTYSI
jgi:hypothetical protein